MGVPEHDEVNHPSHYTAYKGIEIIELTEQMNFNRGNAVKYIARAGLKDESKEIQDLEKAIWYIRREIDRINRLSSVEYDVVVKTQTNIVNSMNDTVRINNEDYDPYRSVDISDPTTLIGTLWDRRDNTYVVHAVDISHMEIIIVNLMSVIDDSTLELSLDDFISDVTSHTLKRHTQVVTPEL